MLFCVLLFLYLFDCKNTGQVCEIFAEVKIIFFFLRKKAYLCIVIVAKPSCRKKSLNIAKDNGDSNKYYMENKQTKNAETETGAVSLFIKIMEHNHKNITFKDIRRDPNKEANADIMATGDGYAKTFFEIKSTKAKEKYWGRIAFGEILSALDAAKKGYNYFFVIIRMGQTGNVCQFICPENAKYRPFLTLEEMLKYTNGKFSFGIDFIVRYNNAKDKKLLAYAEDADNDQSYTIDNLKEKRALIEMISQNDHS